MASYLPWYGKKRERLSVHEREFVALLQNEMDESRLANGAEAVRVAQIRALKAKRAKLPPSEKNATAVANLDREIQCWLALTIHDVIERYRTGQFRGPRAKTVRQASA